MTTNKDFDVALKDSDSDDVDNSESDDDEYDVEDSVVCLFCTNEFSSISKAIDHLSVDHKFDLADIKEQFHMDEYSYIKMINYIRSNPLDISPEKLKESRKRLWDNEKYLKPVLPLEPWLTFDFEFLEPKKQAKRLDSKLKKDDASHSSEYVKSLLEKIDNQNKLLEQAAIDIEKMKNTFSGLLDDGDKKSNTLLNENSKVYYDDNYFHTYSHYGIHFEMLSDSVRTESYRDAIEKNKKLFSGKYVLDVGCGTGILSMFASTAGARQVFAVDQSDIVYQAMDIVRSNNISNIELIKGRIEDIKLPLHKVDIIISEWMGYFLLFEGMIDSIIYARDNYLCTNGILLPNRCTLSLLGYGNYTEYKDKIQFWENVYGYDMHCMKAEVIKEASVEICDPTFILSDVVLLADFDLMTVDRESLNFSTQFKLVINQSGTLTSLVGFFDTIFELPHYVSFTTSPKATPTHWKQTIFYLEKPIMVHEGEIIDGSFKCTRDLKNQRGLVISVQILGARMQYYLD